MEVYKGVPLINKMLDVYIANLAQKNPVTSKSLLIRQKEEKIDETIGGDDQENIAKACEIFTDKVVEYFDFLYKLKYHILPTMEIYGDSFVEVVNLKSWDLYSVLKGQSNAGSYFIGESALSDNKHEKKKSAGKTSTQNISSILESINTTLSKTSTFSESSIDNICERVAEILCNDGEETLAEEIYINESLTSDESKGIINLTEGLKNRSTDSAKAFYEYALDETKRVVPILRSIVEKNEKDLYKKRGRKRKLISENFEEFLTSNQATSYNLNSLSMMLHKPENIIILETSYGSKLGYLEVMNSDNAPVTNVSQQLHATIGRVINLNSVSLFSKDEILSRIVKAVLKKIISNAKLKSGLDLKQVIDHLNPDVLNTIKKLIVETQKGDNKYQYKRINARFIPIERMFQFSVPSSDFAPYGKSFIDPLVLPGKLFILAQMSNIINKLSRAALVRKWVIDVGPTQQVRPD